MVIINWLKRLTVSDKTLTIFLISKVILSDLSHWDVLSKTSLGRRPMLCFGFVGRPFILIQDLVGPIILGDLQNILQRLLRKVFEISFQEKKFIFL